MQKRNSLDILCNQKVELYLSLTCDSVTGAKNKAHLFFLLFSRGMPAAFRELFESFMNVCISLLILSLFAWQALASLRESLGGEM